MDSVDSSSLTPSHLKKVWVNAMLGIFYEAVICLGTFLQRPPNDVPQLVGVLVWNSPLKTERRRKELGPDMWEANQRCWKFAQSSHITPALKNPT